MQRSNSRDTKKDSGWAWLILLSAFIAMFLETGMLKSLGVFLPVLRQQFSTHTWVIGLIISLVPGCGIVACPMAGALTKKFSSRSAMIALSLLSSLGLIIGSFAASVNMLATSLILTGFTLGAETVTLEVLSKYFKRFYDIADGVAHAGVSFGVIIMPPLTQLLLDVYGWRGTMLILGGLSLHLLVCGALIRPLDLYHTEEQNHDGSDQVQAQENCTVPDERRSFECYNANCIRASISHYLDLTLFTNLEFMTFLWISTASGYYYTGWLIYLVPHAIDIGFLPYQAAALATVGGVGHLLGNIVFPLAAKLLSGVKLVYLSILMASLALAVDPLFSAFHSYVGLMLASAAFGFSRAMTSCSVIKIVVSVDEEATISNALSWLLVGYSVGSVFSGFFSGWLYDQTGSYTLSFLCLSIISLLSLSLRFILDIRNYYTKEKRYSSLPFLDRDSD